MWAVFKREIVSFFASPTAYLIMGLFLFINGLFLWVFQGPFNIFDYGFADLSNFFLLAPWIFLFLIPAICMKSLSEEIKMGTLELMYIKPPSLWHMILGKYLAALVLALLAVIPTLVYVYSISELGASPGNLDIGLAIGSYLGLIFIAMTYAGISIFTSSLTDNQIVAFIGGLVLCFLLFYAGEGLATIVKNGETALFVQNLGLKARLDTMARGILDTRDIIYFMSISVLFLFLAVLQLKYRKR